MTITNLSGWVGLKGDSNPMWKGEKAGYRAIHYWVKRTKGAATQCQFCGKEKTTPKSIQWANKSKTYKRDPDDWISLCVSCHRKFDMTPEWRKKIMDNISKAQQLRWKP